MKQISLYLNETDHILKQPTMVLVKIGVAHIMQLRTCVIKIKKNIEGRSPNVVKVIFYSKELLLKGKNLLPLGANSFL